MGTDNVFLKKHGFERPPMAFFEGSYSCHKSSVVANLECKMCGNKININFRGNPDTMNANGIREWILLRAEKLHQCPAVAEILDSKRHKHFADIRRGNDKLKEQEYRNKRGGRA